MKKIVIFGGTTEGRELAELLTNARVNVVYCVATEYGKETVFDSRFIDVRIGRMDYRAMKALFEENSPDAIVDCTHPFAEIVKKEIDNALFECEQIPFFRIVRDGIDVDYTGCEFFDSAEDCAKALEQTEGSIFLTTGSKELHIFCKNVDVQKRLVVRVIPSVESLQLCAENGLNGKQIIAMQGPFSTAMNRVQLRDSNATVMVLKDSGKISGESERISAARAEGVQCFIIKRPEAADDAVAFSEAIAKLEKLLNVRLSIDAFDEITPDVKVEVTLAGFGMGFGSLTEEVKEKIAEADLLFGAPRLMAVSNCKGKKHPYYLAKDVLPVLMEKAEKNSVKTKAVILFSGDTGFYSGTKKMIDALKNDGRFKVQVLPGISSVSALAARCKETIDDAFIMSTHGLDEKLWLPRLIEAVKYHEKTYTLTSGEKDVRLIGELLLELENTFNLKFDIVAGYNLYSNEKLIRYNAAKCSSAGEEGLCVLLIKNRNPIKKKLVPGLKDDEFLRNKTPMSKEEIRALSICKLGVTEDSIVYDIGSGSGSVAVELGLLHPSINVYGVEFKEEACDLIRQNIDKFGLKNVNLVEGVAPEILDNLPVPTHVFIGGSGGRLEEIISFLKAKDRKIRVVINAVTLETVAEINQLLKSDVSLNADFIQVLVNRAKTVGEYNILQAQNPVYIVSFTLGE